MTCAAWVTLSITGLKIGAKHITHPVSTTIAALPSWFLLFGHKTNCVSHILQLWNIIICGWLQTVTPYVLMAFDNCSTGITTICSNSWTSIFNFTDDVEAFLIGHATTLYIAVMQEAAEVLPLLNSWFEDGFHHAITFAKACTPIRQVCSHAHALLCDAAANFMT